MKIGQVHSHRGDAEKKKEKTQKKREKRQVKPSKRWMIQGVAWREGLEMPPERGGGRGSLTCAKILGRKFLRFISRYTRTSPPGVGWTGGRSTEGWGRRDRATYYATLFWEIEAQRKGVIPPTIGKSAQKKRKPECPSSSNSFQVERTCYRLA